MALQLFASHHLQTLADQLLAALRDRPLGVWDKQVLVTQTEGINNWLQERMAYKMGIAAHLEFTKPNELVDVLSFILLGPQARTLTREVMTWPLYTILQEQAFLVRFPEWTSYVQDPIKRISLAGKMADLFDQYEVYRPQTIQTWNALTEETATDWQAWLWVKMRGLTKAEYNDKTQAVVAMLDVIKQPEKQALLQRRMPLLSFFGLAVITPFYLQLFQALGQYIDIHFYLLNPAPEQYWLEDESEKRIARLRQRAPNRPELEGGFVPGNSLLLNWGKIVKDSFYLLFQEEAFINSYTVLAEEDFSAPVNTLQVVQQEVYNNCPPTERATLTTDQLRDGSISFHNCFTPVREVEVLYNFLVSLIDTRGESLSPRDIVVMVTDIDKYAPYIRAVLDHAPYRFPYQIADEKITGGNNLFTALQQLLEFDTERFTAESVLELLDYPPIRNRFGLQDISFVRRCLLDANIRFGWAGSKEDDTRFFSWQYGLKKLLLGICVSGSPKMEWQDDVVYPTDTAEGSSTTDLIRLYQFVNVLHHQLELRNKPKSLKDWSDYIQAMTDALLHVPGEEEEDEYRQLSVILERLAVHDEAVQEPLEFGVFRHQFLQKLSSETRSHLFHRGGITFCSLIPMRSIPFRVIALLGMNFDVFPRKERHLSFSLLEQAPQRGDRNVKDNDRHLFLETLLSARSYLYISFLGRDVKNGNPKPPSSLVDELAEYLVQALPSEERFVAEALYQKHPLYGFSQAYFKPNGLLSYLSDAPFLGESNWLALQGEAPMLPVPMEIDVADWLSCFRHPIRWHVRKRFGIYYEEESLTLPETELFELDFLSRYSRRNDLLRLDPNLYPDFLLQRQQTAELPLRNMGKVVLEKVVEDIQPIRERWDALTQGAVMQVLDVDYRWNDCRLYGTIDGIYNGQLVVAAFSSHFLTDLLSAVHRFVVLRACGHSVNLVFLPFTRDNSYQVLSDALLQAEAEDWLQRWMRAYQQTWQAPYPLWAKWVSKPELLTDFLSLSRESFIGQLSKLAEGDAYAQLMLRNQWPSDDQFDALQEEARRVFELLIRLFPDLVR